MVAYISPVAPGGPAGARKRPRKRIASVRPRIHTPFKANMVWAHDFVFDTTVSGQQIKCLTVVDEYTRECLVIDVAGRFAPGG